MELSQNQLYNMFGLVLQILKPIKLEGLVIYEKLSNLIN